MNFSIIGIRGLESHCCGPIASAVASAVFSAVASKVLSPKPKASNDNAAAMKAAQRKQDALLKQQEAAVAQERRAADAQEADLSKTDATIRRASIARRTGRGGLAFSGPATALKSTFGG